MHVACRSCFIRAHNSHPAKGATGLNLGEQRRFAKLQKEHAQGHHEPLGI